MVEKVTHWLQGGEQRSQGVHSQLQGYLPEVLRKVWTGRSCKVAVGVPPTQGGDIGLRMVHTYSRDALAEPLAKLVSVLTDIRLTKFQA